MVETLDRPMYGTAIPELSGRSISQPFRASNLPPLRNYWLRHARLAETVELKRRSWAKKLPSRLIVSDFPRLANARDLSPIIKYKSLLRVEY